MNYFERLQEKYTNPRDAYFIYEIDKRFSNKFILKDSNDPDLLELKKLNDQILNYCESLKNNLDKCVSFLDYMGITSSDGSKYLSENLELFYDLGYDRNSAIDLILGKTLLHIDEASRNVSFEDLEKIINTEKPFFINGEKEILEQEIVKVCEDFGLRGMFLSKFSETNEITNKIKEALSQLSLVVGCAEKQIGINNFVLSIGNSLSNVSGYSTTLTSNIENLYLNYQTFDSALAHEWLHSVDRMMANSTYDNPVYQSNKSENIFKLLEESKIKKDSILKESIDKTLDRVEECCEKLINRYKISDNISEQKASELLSIIKIILSGDKKYEDFNKKDLAQEYPAPLIAYLGTELELHEKLSKGDINNSIFYEYAVLMDNNLRSLNKLDEDEVYSLDPIELFARSFEGFVAVKLKESGITDNQIAKCLESHYTPNELEAKELFAVWEPVLSDLREMINKRCPNNNAVSISFNLDVLEKLEEQSNSSKVIKDKSHNSKNVY